VCLEHNVIPMAPGRDVCPARVVLASQRPQVLYKSRMPLAQTYGPHGPASQRLVRLGAPPSLGEQAGVNGFVAAMHDRANHDCPGRRCGRAPAHVLRNPDHAQPHHHGTSIQRQEGVGRSRTTQPKEGHHASCGVRGSGRDHEARSLSGRAHLVSHVRVSVGEE
jgi:hypothetical protein